MILSVNKRGFYKNGANVFVFVTVDKEVRTQDREGKHGFVGIVRD